MGGDGTRRLNPGEDLSDAHLRHRDGDLDRHVRGYTQPAFLVGNLALRVRMRGRDNATNHDERNTQDAEENPPRRSQVRCCVSAQHPITIAEFQKTWK